jgi:hypothetical protein
VQSQRVQEALAVIQGKKESSDGALAVVRNVMRETRDSFKSEFDAWGEGLQKSHQDMCWDVESDYTLGFQYQEFPESRRITRRGYGM